MGDILTASEFFRDHMAYSYPVDTAEHEKSQLHWKQALSLAWAEAWAEEAGLKFAWMEDDADPEGEFDDPRDVEHVRQDGWRVCLLYKPCDRNDHDHRCAHAAVLTSLCGITESLDTQERDNYRRVVQAELALDVMAGQEQEE